jgi:hypothetical protein
MKRFISILFLIIPVTFLYAQEKQISIQEKNISLENAFEQIERQTGYSIAFNAAKIDVKKKIPLSLKNASLEEALSVILKDTGLSYTMNGYHIILVASVKPAEKEAEKAQTSAITQTIRGTVTDAETGYPIEFAAIVLFENPTIGTVSDSLGHFRLDHIPVGRCNLKASFVGYNPYIYHEILVTSAREVYLDIPLQENHFQLDEVVITPHLNKEQPLNPMALNGKMLSVEEASRYAGGFDDPARLVTAFAGVAGNFSSNSISIRGNAPQSLQWKLEGVEIPNPNHYQDVIGVGGGMLTVFSTQVLGNSDFFAGAFPAEYSNALSGIFDMQLRNGNNQRYQHAAQIGTLGVEFASEGPFKKGGQSSYIFNYRYSSLALVSDIFPNMAGKFSNIRYQDFSFKVNLPTSRMGTFTLWGTGAVDRYGNPAVDDSTKWESDGDSKSINTQQMFGAAGLGHKYYFNGATYLKTTLAATFLKSRNWAYGYDLADMILKPYVDMRSNNTDLVFNTFLNKKISAWHTNRTGMTLTGLFYDTNHQISPDYPSPSANYTSFSNSNGNTLLVTAFSQSVFQFGKQWTANVGINAQFFMLNRRWTLEPRASVKWQAAPKHSFVLSYGMHSRHENLACYFITTPSTGDALVNKNLDMAKAHHIVLSYDQHISDNLHLKIEPYYQYLYDVPVSPDSPFSIINQFDFFLNKQLVNDGKGRNYGIDLTLERYLANGYYYLLTASIFDSRYCGGDGVWRNTRFNRHYVFNATVGKEWMLGSRRQNVLGVNLRLAYQGGEHYTPVDEALSNVQKKPVFDESRTMKAQMPAAFPANVTVSFKVNKQHVAHEFALKLLNITGYKEYRGFNYFYATDDVRISANTIMIPNLSYKVEF